MVEIELVRFAITYTKTKNATLLFTSNALCNGPIIFFVDIYLITPFFIFCLVCLFYVGYINLSHSTHTHIHTKYIHKDRNQSGTIFGCYKLLHKTPIIFIIMSNKHTLEGPVSQKERVLHHHQQTLYLCHLYINVNQSDETPTQNT